MTLPVRHRRYSVEEYLRLEAESSEKHEYWDGLIVPLAELIAMAGGTYEHSRISANTIRALGNRLEGGRCSVMTSDMRIKISRSPMYFYPDVSVLCAPPQFDPQAGGRTTLLNPKVVIEVISPSTESYDRHKKLVHYIQIPSLEEYVLISQDEPRIDTYFRHGDGSWTFNVFRGADATLALQSLDVSVSLAAVYAGVDFPSLQGPVTG